MWTFSFFSGNFFGPTLSGILVENFGFRSATLYLSEAYSANVILDSLELCYNIYINRKTQSCLDYETIQWIKVVTLRYALFVLQWTQLYGISLGQTIIDLINQMINITKYICYTKYTIERPLWLVQSGSVRSHELKNPIDCGPLNRRPLYFRIM